MDVLDLSSKECFLFDFDGTLIDSTALHAAAFRHVLALHRSDLLGDFDYESHKGQSTLDVFRGLLGSDDDEAKRFTILKQTEYRRLAATQLVLLPYARETLMQLARAGKELFLVTGGSAASVHHSLAAVDMQNIFEGVVTADDVLKSKPDPESYRLCLERYRLSASSCVAVEDAVNGVAAARGAGLDVVGVHNVALASVVDMFFNDLRAFNIALEQHRMA